MSLQDTFKKGNVLFNFIPSALFNHEHQGTKNPFVNILHSSKVRLNKFGVLAGKLTTFYNYFLMEK